jgi:hypothetical protein
MAGLHLNRFSEPKRPVAGSAQMLQDYLRMQAELIVLKDENARLREEVERLRDALERHAMSLVPDEPGRH